MSGYIKDENSLAAGIPDRTIGPETGSYGNAIMTNKGDTAQGTNQAHESYPAPAAGFDGPHLTTDDGGVHHATSSGAPEVSFAKMKIEPAVQQIADGGDHYDRRKHLHGLVPRSTIVAWTALDG